MAYLQQLSPGIPPKMTLLSCNNMRGNIRSVLCNVDTEYGVVDRLLTQAAIEGPSPTSLDGRALAYYFVERKLLLASGAAAARYSDLQAPSATSCVAVWGTDDTLRQKRSS